MAVVVRDTEQRRASFKGYLVLCISLAIEVGPILDEEEDLLNRALKIKIMGRGRNI